MSPPTLRVVPALFLLPCSLAAQSTLFEVTGSPSDGFGARVDTLGDVDGDGRGDFLVSAPNELHGTRVEAGAVYVYSGADAHVLHTVRGNGAQNWLGSGASATGDVDGDGFADFLVGAPGERVPRGTQGGVARVFSGRTGSVLFEFKGGRIAEGLGTACAEMGDVDGDGHADVLVSAPGTISPNNVWGGAITLYSGADGHVLVRVYGDRAAQLLGNSYIHSVGDEDGDGRADFGGLQGVVLRIFSSADGHEIRRGSYPIIGGSLVSSGGLDANGDGFGDYLIGTNATDNGRGRVQVLSGRDGALLSEFFGEQQGVAFGESIVGLSDVDGDGYGDFATGVPYSGPAGTQTGTVRAISGRTGREIGRVHGNAAMFRLGTGSIGGGHDVNGDGVADVIVAARYPGVVKVVSFVPRGLEPFGEGTAGCAGKLGLLANGVPTVGNTSFEMHLSGVGDAITSLWLSDRPDVAGTLRFNARFHLDLTRLLSRTLLRPADAHHSLVVSLPIPADPALLGVTSYLQGVSFFTLGTCARRICTTPGLRLTFQ